MRGIKRTDADDHIVLFSTGRKDTENKLIFQGDILEDCLEQRFEVVWQNEFTSYSLKYIGDKGISYHSLNGKLKVIGNIYEDKGLLK